MKIKSNIIDFSENEYSVIAKRIDTNIVECIYETKSRKILEIGDKVLLDGQQLIICGVSAAFAYGELIFRYQMKYKQINPVHALLSFPITLCKMGVSSTLPFFIFPS